MIGRLAWVSCALLSLLSVLGRDSAHDPVDGLTGVQPQFVGPVQPEVSLEDPAALEDLRYRNPEHYRKITELLSRLG